MSEFRFKQFSVRNDTALKVGTDAVLLGAAMALDVGAKRYLDIGAGTGVISLMVAQRQPEALIEAVEIDDSASLTPLLPGRTGSNAIMWLCRTSARKRLTIIFSAIPRITTLL